MSQPTNERVKLTRCDRLWDVHVGERWCHLSLRYYRDSVDSQYVRVQTVMMEPRWEDLTRAEKGRVANFIACSKDDVLKEMN